MRLQWTLGSCSIWSTSPLTAPAQATPAALPPCHLLIMTGVLPLDIYLDSLSAHLTRPLNPIGCCQFSNTPLGSFLLSFPWNVKPQPIFPCLPSSLALIPSNKLAYYLSNHVLSLSIGIQLEAVLLLYQWHWENIINMLSIHTSAHVNVPTLE
jgi:hypothetical protein